jgi:hypothetical protein
VLGKSFVKAPTITTISLRKLGMVSVDIRIMISFLSRLARLQLKLECA